MHIPPRTRGGHCSYGPEHLERLQFIRRARALGFGIEDIRTLLKLSVHGANACGEAKEIAASQLANVRAKLRDLVRLEAILAGAIAVAKCDAVALRPPLVRYSKYWKLELVLNSVSESFETQRYLRMLANSPPSSP